MFCEQNVIGVCVYFPMLKIKIKGDKHIMFTQGNNNNSIKEDLKGESFSVISKARCLENVIYTGYGIRILTNRGTFYIDDLSVDREAVQGLVENLNKEEEVLLSNIENIIEDFLS